MVYEARKKEKKNLAWMAHGLQISLKRDARTFDGNWARYELWERWPL